MSSRSVYLSQVQARTSNASPETIAAKTVHSHSAAHITRNRATRSNSVARRASDSAVRTRVRKTSPEARAYPGEVSGHRRARLGLASVGIALALLAGCTIGDGEGARYTGRVVRVSGSQVCVGPNTSSPTNTCGSVPPGFSRLPQVGQCMSLFAHVHGRKLSWTNDSLNLAVPDNACGSRG